MKNRKLILIGSLLIATMAVSSVAAGFKPVNAQQENNFFTLHMMAPKGNQKRIQVAKILTNELPKIGINVEMHIVDFSEFLPRMYAVRDNRNATGWEDDQGGAYDMYVVQFGFGSSPQGMIYQFGSNSSWQCSGYRNGQVDTLLDKAGTTLNTTKREKLYWKVSKKIYHDLPIAAYWRIQGTYPMNKKVENYNPRLGNNALWQWKIQGEDNIHYVQPTGVDNLLPIFMGTGYSERSVGYPVYDPLVELNENYRPKVGREGLAKNWTWINDTFIKFDMYENATWHDGEPVTAEDAVFTYRAIMDSATKAQEYTTFKRAGVERVVQTGNYSLGVKLQEPYAPFLVEVGTTRVLPKHILKDVPHKDWKTHWMNTGTKNGNPKFPIGCGPYKMTKWVEDDHITLKKYSDYYLGEPKTPTIYMDTRPEGATAMSALKKGEVDILNMWYGFTPKQLDSVKEDKDLTIATSPVLGAQQVGFNLQNPRLSNRYVRWAINYMIPRERIIEDVCGGYGKPTSQYLPEGMLGHNPNLEPVNYSVSQAKHYMELAGYSYDRLEAGGMNIPMWFYAIPVVTFFIGLGGAYVALRRK